MLICHHDGDDGDIMMNKHGVSSDTCQACAAESSSVRETAMHRALSQRMYECFASAGAVEALRADMMNAAAAALPMPAPMPITTFKTNHPNVVNQKNGRHADHHADAVTRRTRHVEQKRRSTSAR